MTAVSPAAISRYGLFGETRADDNPEFVHIEDIQTRSRLYQWRITPHTHQSMFQIVVVQDGMARVQLDGADRPLVAPCAVTIPGGAVHGFSFSPDTRGYVVTVSDVLWIDARYRRSRKLFEPLFDAPLVIDLAGAPDQTALIDATLDQLLAEHQWPQLGRSSMFEWLLRTLMMVLRRRLDIHSTTDIDRDDTFETFRQAVEDRYREHWTLTDYARALGLSPARLNRLCRAATAKSAFELIQDRVMLEARRNLVYTSASAAMIAYELGFQDPAYFARFFKRHAGMTPGQYRKSAGAGPV